MGKIYIDSGWVNWDYILSQPAAFIQVIGARGVGKTYGLMKKLIREKKKFLCEIDQQGNRKQGS